MIPSVRARVATIFVLSLYAPFSFLLALTTGVGTVCPWFPFIELTVNLRFSWCESEKMQKMIQFDI